MTEQDIAVLGEVSFRVVRVSSLTPKCCSSCEICLATAAWLRPRSRDTAENDPVSTTRTNTPNVPIKSIDVP